eukprot:11422829-Alexandrium_andersonii.AAC.1
MNVVARIPRATRSAPSASSVSRNVGLTAHHRKRAHARTRLLVYTWARSCANERAHARVRRHRRKH